MHPVYSSLGALTCCHVMIASERLKMLHVTQEEQNKIVMKR